MFRKVLIILLLVFLSLSVVSASDNQTQDISMSDVDDVVATNEIASFTDLQNVINNAKNGDTINLHKNYSYSKNDPTEGILINKSITINGNGAVLDAKNSSRIFSIIGAYDENDDDYENDGKVVLNDLIFKNGNAKNGGAIFVTDSEEIYTTTVFLNITNCGFSNNRAIDVSKVEEFSTEGYGGAIYSIENCVMKIKNSIFINNTCDFEGGAIYGAEACGIEVSDSNFTGNKALFGGAIYSAYLDVFTSNFLNNFASGYAGAICSEYNCNLNVRNSLFQFNKANTGAGAVSFFGSANISDSKFLNNSGKSDGGAICANGDDDTINILNSVFIGNSAGYGGAIDFVECLNVNGKIINCLFKSNTATVSGGAFTDLPDTLKLSNNTFENNNLEEVYIKYFTFRTTFDSGKILKVTIYSRLTNKPIANAKVSLRLIHSLSDKKSSYKILHATTNSKGVASFKTISKLAANYYEWGYDFSVKNYGSSWSDGYLIEINKAPTIVKAPKVTAKFKKSKYFKVTVKNKATKKAVNKIKIKIKVYTGKKYKTYNIKTNKKGVAKFNTKILKRGTHKVVISSGNSNYKISAKSTIKIK